MYAYIYIYIYMYIGHLPDPPPRLGIALHGDRLLLLAGAQVVEVQREPLQRRCYVPDDFRPPVELPHRPNVPQTSGLPDRLGSPGPVPVADVSRQLAELVKTKQTLTFGSSRMWCLRMWCLIKQIVL